MRKPGVLAALIGGGKTRLRTIAFKTYNVLANHKGDLPMKRLLISVAFALCATVVAAAPAPAQKVRFDPAVGLAGKSSVDIIGIKLGMPEADAMKVIAARSPKLKTEVITYTDPAVKRVEAVVDGCRLGGDCEPGTPNVDKGREELAVEFLDGKVWFVRREALYNPQAATTPTHAAAFDSAVAKYGTLVSYANDYGKIIGAADIRGVNYSTTKGLDSKGGLINEVAKDRRKYAGCDSGYDDPKSQLAPQFFDGVSSWGFYFGLNGGDRNGVGMAHSIVVKMVDCSTMREHVVRQQAAEKAKQAAQTAAQKKAVAGNKPEL